MVGALSLLGWFKYLFRDFLTAYSRTWLAYFQELLIPLTMLNCISYQCVGAYPWVGSRRDVGFSIYEENNNLWAVFDSSNSESHSTQGIMWHIIWYQWRFWGANNHFIGNRFFPCVIIIARILSTLFPICLQLSLHPTHKSHIKIKFAYNSKYISMPKIASLSFSPYTY